MPSRVQDWRNKNVPDDVKMGVHRLVSDAKITAHKAVSTLKKN